MGNFFECCRKPYTVQYNSELPLGNIDTNFNDHDGPPSPGKLHNTTFDVQNKTIRRSVLFTPKTKESNNLGTEINDNFGAVRYRDDFMKNYTLMLDGTYGSSFNNLFFDNEFEINFPNVQYFIEQNKEVIPILNLYILNALELENVSKIEEMDFSNNKNQVKSALSINPFGLFGKIKSIREKNDGITIFGISKTKGDIKPEENSPIDYQLDLNFAEYEDILNLNNFNKTSPESDLIPLFAIKFDLQTLRYYIKDLHSGVSTIFKVKNETVLKNNSLITIGDSYILITFGDASNPSLIQSSNVGGSANNNNELINLKVFNRNGQLIHDPINFQPSKSSIRIGRGKENEIVVNDATISRTHCTVQYDEVVGWTIRDGHFQKRNRRNEYTASTNGSWVYVGESSVVVDGLLLRCGSVTIQCLLEQNK